MRISPQSPSGAPAGRLNLLLSYGGWRDEAAVLQAPRLLEPLGICTMEAGTCEEAEDLIRTRPIHIAVVDLEIPLRAAGPTQPSGLRILQLLRRLDSPPPTIVVRPRQASARDDVRGLLGSLRDGAFAVLDRPMRLEALLDTLHRALRRHYKDLWPADAQPGLNTRNTHGHGHQQGE
jgi:DNA-binding response OmpR family regulator